MAGIGFVRHGFFSGKKSALQPQTCSLHSDSSKKNCRSEFSIYLCLAAKEKFDYHFLATTFLHMVTEKKFSRHLAPA